MPSIDYNEKYYTTHFKSEMILDRSAYNVLDIRQDKLALAQTIQNIILFRPGNFPNQPQLGVGIEDYLFELADDATLRKLKENIESQIKAYAPTTFNVNFTVNHDTKNSVNVVTIDFKIMDTNDTEALAFSINFGTTSNNKKVVSKLI